MSLSSSLKGFKLLDKLNKDQLEKVAGLCRSSSYRKGETIFKEGDKAEEFYFITEGNVALELEIKPVPNRPAIPTAMEVITKGDCTGWSAIVEPHIYQLTARCITNSSVLGIKGNMLRKAMVEDTKLGFEIMTGLTQIISERLMNTRLRLISGIGLALLGKEMSSK